MKVFRLATAVGLLIIFIGLIVLLNGGGETAVSAETSIVAGGPNVTMSLLTGGFSQPVDITNAGDNRLFVVEQPGEVKIINANGSVRTDPFLDIMGRVHDGGEQGLLGLAFDPDYTNNGFFYVNYNYCTATCPTNSSPSPNLYTRISRFSVTSDPQLADPNSELILMEVQQPYGNHNGGDLSFGPDGYLYIGLGDGGGSGDPQNRSQNEAVLLGKMLRIDVHGGGNAAECDSDGNYTIPANNPFLDGAGGACDEIWAMGLRNPWRFSFDSATGDMFIGDVGQSAKEEVNFQPANSGGMNWGWRCYEADLEYNTTGCADISNYDFPFFEYDRDANGGTAVTGGYVYRGDDYPDLTGYYLFADHSSGNFWTAVASGGGNFNVTPLGSFSGLGSPSTFGEGCDHELYVADRGDGQIYQITQTVLILGAGSENIYLPFIVGDGATPTPTPTTTPMPTATPTPTSTPMPVQCN